MAIEVYKHEVGCDLGHRLTRWTFFWEVSNVSGDDPTQVSAGIADSLNGFLKWFFLFREFWGVNVFTKVYRIRRVWPAISTWNDYYYPFREYGGRFFLEEATHVVKARVQWLTLTPQLSGACTYLNQFPQEAFKNNRLTGQSLTAVKLWADNHIGPHTTPHGDAFRPVILEKSGNYYPVLGYRVYPHAIGSRAQRVKE